MQRIRVLDPHTSELIAAGEVVERPASVVKELIENSIDAGARNVTVEIKNGGVSYIRITDNGCGISREDVDNAFVSHATSKIAAPDDLDSIMTLGFRGEALASVARVARVELLTKSAEEETGTRYVIEGGEHILTDDAGCPKGTTIIVRNLFYNTPARMKFLKKDVTEANAVAGVVDTQALSHPSVSIRFIRDGKETLFTPGDGSLINTVSAVFGRDFASDLIPAEHTQDGIKVSGFVSKPTAARPNRSMQFFFVNGRYIKTGTGSAALGEAYKNSIMVGKFPACVLNIEIPPHTVDVNVHPAKVEVRFSNEKQIFNAVYYSVKNALQGDRSRAQYKPSADEKAVKAYLDMLNLQKSREKFNVSSNPRAAITPSPRKAVEPFVDLSQGKKAQTEQAGYISEPEAPYPAAREETELHDIKPHTQPQTVLNKTDEQTTQKPLISEQPKVIGEAFRTYIFAQYGESVFIIDKHAAHERMIFDELKARSDNADRQMLLMPVTVTLSKNEYAAVIENLDALLKCGYAVEDFGSGAVIVSECPLEIDREDIEYIIPELAGYLVENRNELISEKMDWLYHSTACRAAIKAGDFTSEYERERFVKKLFDNPDIRCCPHGRPVMMEMTKREMEKNFGRVQ